MEFIENYKEKEIKVSKECGTCTKCCEGWLTHPDIRGHSMYPGKTCFFLEINKGCRDYENRPENPCKNFKCGWLTIDDMPEEFKPEKSGVIMHVVKENNITFCSLTKAPNDPNADFLSWAISFVASKGLNLFWSINNKSFWIGSPEFCDTMEKQNVRSV
jgi:hypothetical protein